MQPSRISSGFNFLSPFYDLFSKLFFGNAILNSQTYFLPQLGKFENVLIFGGGTGKLLIELIKLQTGKNYTYVDVSEKMIAKTKKRFEKYMHPSFSSPLGWLDGVFICGSYEDIASEKKFDLIITPYVLDCFSEKKIPEVIKVLNNKLSSNGKWLFVDFNIPEKGMMNFFSKLIIRTLYFFFNIFCGLGIKKLPAFKHYFQSAELKSEKEKLFLNEMLCATIYSRQ